MYLSIYANDCRDSGEPKGEAKDGSRESGRDKKKINK